MNTDSRIHPALKIFCFTLCLLAFSAASMPAQTVDDLKKEMAALKQGLQEQRDIHEIQNLMSLRAFLHGAQLQGKELELWTDRDDASFGMNPGFRVGMKSIRAAYDIRFTRVKRHEVGEMHKIYPDIANNQSSFGVGGFQMHTLTSPIIVVAGDGQTAKGMWYTPGMVAGPSAKGGGATHPFWMWEKYAVDFIKEDGRWKFWHVLVVTDFGVPIGHDFSQQSGGVFSVEGGFTQEPMIPMDVPRQVYKEYSATTIPHLYPPPPVPYKTFSETFTYGPGIPPMK